MSGVPNSGLVTDERALRAPARSTSLVGRHDRGIFSNDWIRHRPNELVTVKGDTHGVN